MEFTNQPETEAATPAAPLAREDVGGEGSASSNTEPSTQNSLVLRHGVDSLYLSYQGKLSAKNTYHLDVQKQFAQSKDEIARAAAQFMVGDMLFTVMGKGRKGFNFVLSNSAFEIALALQSAGNMPFAYIKVKSEYLAHHTLKETVRALNGIMNILGTVEGEATISRVDLFADVITDYPLGGVQKHDFKAKSHRFVRYEEKIGCTGVTIGLGGNIAFRLYNKTVEVQKKQRPYLEAMWRQAGWDGEQDIWRIEYQFKRPFLATYKVTRCADLGTRLKTLWEYSTKEWCQLLDETHDVWSIVQSAFDQEPDEPLERSFENSKVPADEFFAKKAWASITSYMAKANIDNVETGMAELLKVARKWFARHHMKESQFDHYIMQKVQGKRRLFNKSLNFSDLKECYAVKEADDAAPL